MSAPDEGGNPWKSEAGGFGDRSNQHALKRPSAAISMQGGTQWPGGIGDRRPRARGIGKERTGLDNHSSAKVDVASTGIERPALNTHTLLDHNERHAARWRSARCGRRTADEPLRHKLGRPVEQHRNVPDADAAVMA